MEVLFIEDEPGKKDTIKYYLDTFDDVKIDIAESINTGIRSLYAKQYDLVLLDMSLPLFDNDENSEEYNEFEPFGGIEVLDEIQRKKYEASVVIITAYDIIEDRKRRLNLEQLDKTMKEEYPSIYSGCIFYNQTSIAWKEAINRIINNVTFYSA